MAENPKQPQQEELNANLLTPSEYFAKLKDAKQTMTEGKLKNSFGVILELADKYTRIGQKRSLDKLKFLAQTLREEEKLIPLGITTFVYRDVIEDYIDSVANDVVKIIELENYMREIPDEVAEAVAKTRDIFNGFYVVFTDYTGREERRVTQERREKDPILFGCFKQNNWVADRFYFIGDWVDEYCDLTLDKFVEQYRAKKDNMTPLHTVETPQTAEELVELLKAYVPKDKEQPTSSLKLVASRFDKVIDATVTGKQSEKKSFFQKVRSIFSSK